MLCELNRNACSVYTIYQSWHYAALSYVDQDKNKCSLMEFSNTRLTTAIIIVCINGVILFARADFYFSKNKNEKYVIFCHGDVAHVCSLNNLTAYFTRTFILYTPTVEHEIRV